MISYLKLRHQINSFTSKLHYKPLICWTVAIRIIESKVIVKMKKIWFNIMQKKIIFDFNLLVYECGEKIHLISRSV
jgi:hypothetical protein